MIRRIVIGIVLGGVSVLGLVRSWDRIRRPAYESHITGDAAARAGFAMVEEGRFAEAIGALESALRKPLLEVEMSGVYAALGEAYAGMDRRGEGEPLRHKALVYEGLAHRLRGDGGKAAVAFTAAEQVRPDDALAYECLGALRLAEGRIEEAIAQLERAVELDATKAVTRSNLALAYARGGRFDEAELQVRQAERLGYPKLEQLRSLVGRLREERAGRE